MTDGTDAGWVYVGTALRNRIAAPSMLPSLKVRSVCHLLLGAFACALLGIGCFHPTFEEGLPCAEGTNACPDGQFCVMPQMRCFAAPDTGEAPDAAVPRLCNAPESDCNGSCVNLANDPAHCGECDKACDVGELCGNGECALDCPIGLTQCDTACVDLLADDDNCGGCGPTYACADTDECRDGTCQTRCDAQLNGAAVKDPWGLFWDALERAPAPYQDAASLCAGIGGRLPTVTELYRVSAPITPGTIGQTAGGNELWSAIPANVGNRYVVRLDNAGIGTDPNSELTASRCVCPAAIDGFRETACNGDPGAECFPFNTDGENIDRKDRPAIQKSAAIYECALERGHLADFDEFAQAIIAGAPKGGTGFDNVWVHLADDLRAQQSSLIRWVGDGAGWVADGNISNTSPGDSRPFRCAGRAFRTGVYQGAVADEFVGRFMKSEQTDTATTDYLAALDTCWNRGGHLPQSRELAELIQGGLPQGSNTFLWTGDTMGRDNNRWRNSVLRWNATETDFDYAAGTRFDWRRKRVGDDSQPYRCGYYPIDATYAAPEDASCQGGCLEFTLPVSQGRMWFDNADRAAERVEAAHATCKNLGGHLASHRDMAEAIRHGLPNGTFAWVQVSDLSRDGNGGRHQNLSRWTAVNLDYTDDYPDNEFGDLGNAYAFRCMWTNEVR